MWMTPRSPLNSIYFANRLKVLTKRPYIVNVLLQYFYFKYIGTYSINHSTTIYVKFCSLKVTLLPSTLTPASTKLANNVTPCM